MRSWPQSSSCSCRWPGRDDGYGTYASAQYTASRIAGAKFVGFDQGGHTWVGHNEEVMSEVVKLLVPPAKP